MTVTGWAHDAGAGRFGVSAGGLVAGVKIPSGPGYQVHLATAVREGTGAAVNAVGQITTAAQAEGILASGQADTVMVAREFIRDPRFPLRAAHELGVELDYWPLPYTRGKWPH